MLSPICRMAASQKDEASAADAEEVGQRARHQEHREYQRRRGDHVGIVGPTDEPGVRHVVNQGDQLADNRGNRHGQQRLWNGHRFKQRPLLLG